MGEYKACAFVRALFVATLLAESQSAAIAAEMTADSKIDATENDVDRIPQPHFRVWARSTTGDILSRQDADAAGLTGIWTNHGHPAGVTPHARGVAATGHISAGNVNHYVYFVANNNVYEGRVLNGSSISWTNWGSPASVLTGYIAATTYVWGGVRYNAVAVTSLFSGLYVLTRNVTTGAGSWVVAPGTLAWGTGNEIAATTGEGGTVVSFLATHGPFGSLKLGMLRWTGSGWITVNLGAPTGQQVCRSIGVAQARLATTGIYRLYVFCTHASSDQSAVYLAYSTSETSNSFTWITRSVPAGMGTASWRIAGTVADLGSGNKRLDFYLLPSGSSNIYRYSRTNLIDFPSTPVNLGPPPETDSRTGGSVATLGAPLVSGAYHTRLFFIGRMDQQDYLFERRIETSPDNISRWRNVGVDERDHQVSSGSQHAEGMVAEWQGTVAAVMINRPGTGTVDDWPRVHLFWSNDDGQTFGTPVETPWEDPGGTNNDYPYVSDPTVVVSDQRIAYIVQLELKYAQGECTVPGTNNHADALIHLTSTSDGGATFINPVTGSSGSYEIVRQSASPQVTVALDHPFSGIQHVSGGNDVVHVVWLNLAADPDRLEYATYTEGVGISSIYTIRRAGAQTGVYPPRIVVGDQAGEAYVYMGSGSSVWICKLKTDLSNCNSAGNYDCCLGGWHEQSDYLYSQSNTYTNRDPFDPGDPGNGGQHTYMRTSTGFSLGVSHNNPGVLYFCFNADESNTDGPDFDGREEKDVLCTRGVVNQLGQWTWMSPVNPTGASNDDADQFMPEVFVTADDELSGTGETIFVHWYDRRGPGNNRFFGWYGTVRAREWATRSVTASPCADG